MFLGLDDVSFFEGDYLDRLASGVFKVLDLGNDPDYTRHRLAHQARYRTGTPEVNLGLPVDDLYLRAANKTFLLLPSPSGQSTTSVCLWLKKLGSFPMGLSLPSPLLVTAGPS